MSVSDIQYNSKSLTFILDSLYKEYQLYLSLFSLEDQKTVAIIQHKGLLLKKIVDEQKNILDVASAFEKKRMSIWKNNLFIISKNVSSPPSNLLELQQVGILDSSEQEQVLSIRTQYSNLIRKLEKKQSSNQSLLLDNHNFFLSLLSVGKEDLQIGYHDSGEKNTERVSSQKPVFIDIDG